MRLIRYVFILISTLLCQELQHFSSVINIEVPVRVYSADNFVDDLTIDDFEIYDDGILQKTEAVYLIKKTKIERKEERSQFIPKTFRSFYLFFQIFDYNAKIKGALSYFFENLLQPSDELTIVTPLKTYVLKKESFEKISKSEMLRQLHEIIRRDILIGTSEYRSTIEEMKGVTKTLIKAITMDSTIDNTVSSAWIYADWNSVNDQLTRYSMFREKLETLGGIDVQNLLNFAKAIKFKDGQKHVFLFYQRELIPRIEPSMANLLYSLNQAEPGTVLDAMRLFESQTNPLLFSPDVLKKAYSESSITIHFLFFTPPRESVPGIYFEERSDDVFAPFMEMAKATGGTTQSSANPEFLFRKASEAVETYYLLYYAPKNYKPDAKYHELKVKVKKPGFTITHRAGYFAN